MTLPVSRARLDRLERLMAGTALTMLEAAARLRPAAEHDDAEDRAASRRLWLRTLRRLYEARGQTPETPPELRGDSPAQEAADEARFHAWCARQGRDPVAQAAENERVVRGHLRWMDTAQAVLDRLPDGPARAVAADLAAGIERRPETRRVRALADRALHDEVPEHVEGGRDDGPPEDPTALADLAQRTHRKETPYGLASE